MKLISETINKGYINGNIMSRSTSLCHVSIPIC